VASTNFLHAGHLLNILKQ